MSRVKRVVSREKRLLDALIWAHQRMERLNDVCKVWPATVYGLDHQIDDYPDGCHICAAVAALLPPPKAAQRGKKEAK